MHEHVSCAYICFRKAFILVVLIYMYLYYSLFDSCRPSSGARVRRAALLLRPAS